MLKCKMKKIEFIQSFFRNYAKDNYKTPEFDYQTPGFLILWEIHYDDTHNIFLRTDRFCQEMPLGYAELALI